MGVAIPESVVTSEAKERRESELLRKADEEALAAVEAESLAEEGPKKRMQESAKRIPCPEWRKLLKDTASRRWSIVKKWRDVAGNSMCGCLTLSRSSSKTWRRSRLSVQVPDALRSCMEQQLRMAVGSVEEEPCWISSAEKCLNSDMRSQGGFRTMDLGIVVGALRSGKRSV